MALLRDEQHHMLHQLRLPMALSPPFAQSFTNVSGRAHDDYALFT
jgi:hypothetical protein